MAEQSRAGMDGNESANESFDYESTDGSIPSTPVAVEESWLYLDAEALAISDACPPPAAVGERDEELQCVSAAGFLAKRMERSVKSAAETLFVSPDEAFFILAAFKFQEEAVQGAWFDGEGAARVRARLGLSEGGDPPPGLHAKLLAEHGPTLLDAIEFEDVPVRGQGARARTHSPRPSPRTPPHHPPPTHTHARASPSRAGGGV